MIIALIRTLILYFIVVSAMRIMGKRQIGEMQPSELAVAIMISDLASIPMQEIGIPLLSGIVPVLTLLLCEVLMSYLCLKSTKIRRVFAGNPSIIVYNGKIYEKELRRLRFSLSDLLEQLRINGCDGICQVHTAILETNGQLSIIKKSYYSPVTRQDLNIDSTSVLPYLIIADGKVDPKELARAGKNENWLKKELLFRKIEKPDDVLYLELSDTGISWQPKDKNLERKRK